MSKRKRLNRIPWSRDDVYDIWFMVHHTSGFIAQLQKLRSMSMCEPFEVEIDGMPVKQKREMETPPPTSPCSQTWPRQVHWQLYRRPGQHAAEAR